MDPLIQEFTDLFAELSAELHGRGYYQDRPEYTVPNKSRSELGMEKRALLTMARERIDVLYSLPADKLKAIASNELPYVDRKVLPLPITSCPEVTFSSRSHCTSDCAGARHKSHNFTCHVDVDTVVVHACAACLHRPRHDAMVVFTV